MRVSAIHRPCVNCTRVRVVHPAHNAWHAFYMSREEQLLATGEVGFVSVVFNSRKNLLMM